MPKHKFKLPEEGQLVLTKGRWSVFTKPPKVVTNTYTSWPEGRGEIIELVPGQPLMFLETIMCSGHNPYFTGWQHVYKFLADGKVAYTSPTPTEPVKWFPGHIRILKGKHGRKTRS